jgi:hypothetical protein
MSLAKEEGLLRCCTVEDGDPLVIVTNRVSTGGGATGEGGAGGGGGRVQAQELEQQVLMRGSL